MCFLTNRCALLVLLATLCCLQFTDTHNHRTRSRGPTGLARSGSDRTVRDLLTLTQLQSIRTRWAAQGLDPLALEALLRTNSREFIRNHQRNARVLPDRRTNRRVEFPNQERRGRPTITRGRGRDRDGGFVGRNGLLERNPVSIGHEGHGHSGHDHSGIGRNVDGNSRRGRGRGRASRGQNSILPDVGQEERIPDEELQTLIRGRSNERNRGQQMRDRNRPGRTEIGVRDRIPATTRDQIRIRNDGHSHGNEHGHGHEHGLGGNRELIGSSVNLANRQRGGIHIHDGTRHRTGLDRLRTNQATVQHTNNTRRRRRRRRLASVLGSIARSVFG